MLTAEQIENQDYCTNDVADLLMRVQIAQSALFYVVTEIYKTETSDSLVKSAYEFAVNGLGQIEHEHDCEIRQDDDGNYRCQCGLISSAE
jgi:hypothetical protein